MRLNKVNLVVLLALLLVPSPVFGLEGFKVASISIDEQLDLSELFTGTLVEQDSVQVPQWQYGKRYIFIGVHDSKPDITGILTQGINIISSWQRVQGTLRGFKFWRTVDNQNTYVSGAQFVVMHQGTEK